MSETVRKTTCIWYDTYYTYRKGVLKSRLRCYNHLIFFFWYSWFDVSISHHMACTGISLRPRPRSRPRARGDIFKTQVLPRKCLKINLICIATQPNRRVGGLTTNQPSLSKRGGTLSRGRFNKNVHHSRAREVGWGKKQQPSGWVTLLCHVYHVIVIRRGHQTIKKYRTLER